MKGIWDEMSQEDVREGLWGCKELGGRVTAAGLDENLKRQALMQSQQKSGSFRSTEQRERNVLFH